MLLPLLALTACGRDDTPGTQIPPGRINLVTGIEALTRTPQLDDSGAGNFRPGDVFTLTVSDEAQSVQRAYAVGSTTLYWQELGLAGDAATFAGCYPTYGGSSFTFNVTKALEADLLLARAVPVTKGEATVRLPFRHAMHRLTVTYVSSDGSCTADALERIETTLHGRSTHTVDLTKGELAPDSAASPADYATLCGAEVSWLVVPQSRDDVVLTVSLDGRSRIFTLPERTTEGMPLLTLEGGKRLCVMLDVTRNDISIEGTDIGRWEEQGTVEGGIEI